MLHFQFTGYLLGEGRREEGKYKERKTIDQLCCIYSLLPLSTILLLFRFAQKNTADLKKEVSRDPIFRNSRLAKMGSDNVILSIPCRAHAQKGQCFLSVSKIQRCASEANTAVSNYFCLFSGCLTSIGDYQP